MTVTESPNLPGYFFVELSPDDDCVAAFRFREMMGTFKSARQHSNVLWSFNLVDVPHVRLAVRECFHEEILPEVGGG